jgi:uncharacterized protein
VRTPPDLKRWLEAIARDLVDRPESVRVEEVEEDGVTILELTVDPSEVGRIIGRQGRTVQALRTLLEVAEEKQGRSYDLEILE